jgi:phospholipid/cholesterol/gamma-HCH transport system ATP-binding protein
MISIQNISKSFGEKKVLENVSAELNRGKVNMIIGKSGAGKSVMLKCLVGLHNVDEGEILFDGRNMAKMDYKDMKSVRQEMGMLFQGSALFDSLDVESNVMFPLEMFTNMTKKERLDRANFCLERVNIQGANKLFPAEISGGMQKRVAIARAIALNPKYLFCDEPNSGLDPQTSILIDNLIQDLTREYDITTVVISHDMNSVIEIADQITFIHNGQKWWEGDNQSIFTTDNQEIIDFVYASEFMKNLRKARNSGTGL